VHFVRLATTLLKDEENARENHVIACDCQIFTDLKKSLIGSAINPVQETQVRY